MKTTKVIRKIQSTNFIKMLSTLIKIKGNYISIVMKNHAGSF